MRTYNFLACLVVAAGLAAGCGGGGGGGSNNNVNPTQNISQGSADLTTVLATNSTQTPTQKQQTVTSAATLFKQAYQKQPSGQAAVGFVVAESYADAYSASTALGTTLKGVSSTDPLVVRAAANMNLLNLASSMLKMTKINSPFDILPTNLVTPAIATKSTRGGTPSYTTLLPIVQQIDTDCSTFISYLTTANIQNLETSPLVVTVPDPYSTLPNATVSIKIGEAEGYALRSAAEVLKAATDMALGYNTNFGSDTFSTSFATEFASDLNTTTVISPTELLGAPSGFLTLSSASRIKDVGTQLTNACNDATSALNQITARMNKTGDTGWATDVLAGPDYTASNVTLGIGDANQVYDVLTQVQPVTVTNDEGVTAQISVNLQAWFGSKGNPPQNLLAFVPSFTATEDQYGDIELTPVVNSISDPTFGGLVTGVTSDLLYNRSVFAFGQEGTGQVAVALLSFFNQGS